METGDRDEALREQLTTLLRGGNAHLSFNEAVQDFPDDAINRWPDRVEYSFWHLVEHLRITQADIIAYLTESDYQERDWPTEYWPPHDRKASRAEWDASVAAFQGDLERLVTIVNDPETDLFGSVPSHDDHTVLREMLIVADHNAYHIGELAILRQGAGVWGRGHE